MVKKSLIVLLALIVGVGFAVVGMAQDANETQSPSQTFVPPGIIHVITSAVQTDSAQLVSAIGVAIEKGTPPGSLVAFTRFALKNGMSAEDLIACFGELGDLINDDMPPGQALNLVKTNGCGAGETSENTSTASQSQQSDDKKDKPDPPKGPDGNNGKNDNANKASKNKKNNNGKKNK